LAIGKTKLEEYAKKVKSINETTFWLSAANTEQVKKLIIKLNTEIQLGRQNVDSTSKKLSEIGGEYTDFTLELNASIGRPKLGPDRIDLHATGRFWRSWRVTITAKRIIIEADPITTDGTNLTDRWGPKIIGLTNESFEQVKEQIKQNYFREVKRHFNL